MMKAYSLLIEAQDENGFFFETFVIAARSVPEAREILAKITHQEGYKSHSLEEINIHAHRVPADLPDVVLQRTGRSYFEP